MTHEERARHRLPMCGAPDTEVVQEILTQESQVEISYWDLGYWDFVSGAHDAR